MTAQVCKIRSHAVTDFHSLVDANADRGHMVMNMLISLSYMPTSCFTTLIHALSLLALLSSKSGSLFVGLLC